MAIERPQLYAFLLPFTVVSLIIYAQILLEIYRKRKFAMYDSFFFRMICSQSLYDISYVIMYFIMELPADFRAFDGFYLDMKGVLPQLIYAHIYWCQIAQIIGVTIMAISRMMLVCHPLLKITKMLKQLSIKQVIFVHLIIPTCYALYIIFGHGWRYYWYTTRTDNTRRIYRYGKDTVPGESATINSYVLCGFGMAGSLFSAICYVRIFLTLRKRPMRTWSNDIYILATSFVLFNALCIITAFFITNIVVRLSEEYKQGGMLYYYLRDHSYAFTFLLSLANPWCIIISCASMRSSVLRRCLPSCCARYRVFHSIYEHQSIVSGPVTARTITASATALKPSHILIRYNI